MRLACGHFCSSCAYPLQLLSLLSTGEQPDVARVRAGEQPGAARATVVSRPAAARAEASKQPAAARATSLRRFVAAQAEATMRPDAARPMTTEQSDVAAALGIAAPESIGGADTAALGGGGLMSRSDLGSGKRGRRGVGGGKANAPRHKGTCTCCKYLLRQVGKVRNMP